LLNEPTPPGPRWSSAWFSLAQEIRDSIAHINPRAIVFISSTSDLRFANPFRGSNIVYEVHDYVPITLTHAHDKTLDYPGAAPDYDGKLVHWSKEAFSGNGHRRANLGERLSLNWARENGVPVYIGEWGTNNAYTGYVQFVRDRAILYTTVYDAHHAFFVWRGAAKSYGLFPIRGELMPHNEDYLEAAMLSWRHARKPDF
jgi:hypothetical protein